MYRLSTGNEVIQHGVETNRTRPWSVEMDCRLRGGRKRDTDLQMGRSMDTAGRENVGNYWDGGEPLHPTEMGRERE